MDYNYVTRPKVRWREKPEVRKAYGKAYYQANKHKWKCSDAKKAYMAEWRKKNKERRREYQQSIQERRNELARKNHAANPEKRKAYFRKKLATDPKYKMGVTLRRRVLRAVKRKTSRPRTIEMLGCTIVEFMKHIESLWKPGMTWANHGYRGWHIDHVKPCSSFDLTSEREIRKCFHYSNMQPLWMAENFRKGDKYGQTCRA